MNNTNTEPITINVQPFENVSDVPVPIIISQDLPIMTDSVPMNNSNRCIIGCFISFLIIVSLFAIGVITYILVVNV